MDKRPEALHLQKIKKVYRENFLRELTNEEAADILKKMILNTKRELSVVPKTTEKDIKNYMSREVSVVFSPQVIHQEINRIIGEIGLETLEKSKKYKRLGEMSDAACFATALKKAFGEEWMIKGQDNPDILLVRGNGRPFSSKPFNAISLEIMQIPEVVKTGFVDNLENSIANFIREKKFSKRYGGAPHLLVHMNFNFKGLDLELLSKKICKLGQSPFHQIWVRVNADPTSRIMIFALIYPSLARIELDYKHDNKLLY